MQDTARKELSEDLLGLTHHNGWPGHVVGGNRKVMFGCRKVAEDLRQAKTDTSNMGRSMSAEEITHKVLSTKSL